VKCCQVDEKRKPVAGTEFVIKADLVFVAIGFPGRYDTGVISDLGDRLTMDHGQARLDQCCCQRE
jgi:glutamate synthase (NADPH/NADH) small chain